MLASADVSQPRSAASQSTTGAVEPHPAPARYESRHVMILSRLATFGVALLLSTSFGCALSSAESDDASSSEAAAATTPIETFKLYDELESVGGRCEITTVLT